MFQKTKILKIHKKKEVDQKKYNKNRKIVLFIQILLLEEENPKKTLSMKKSEKT